MTQIYKVHRSHKDIQDHSRTESCFRKTLSRYNPWDHVAMSSKMMPLDKQYNLIHFGSLNTVFVRPYCYLVDHIQ